MPRKIVNDVIPPGARRSVRNIPVPSRNYRWSGNDDEQQDDTPSEPTKRIQKGAKLKARWVLWGFVLIALVAMGIAVGISMSGATVTITLKTAPAEVSFSGTAMIATTTSETYLPYEPITVAGSEKASLDSEGTKRVERRASGTITVYNNFSSASQRLIKNTRFETSEGKIYRIPESIIVPGKKTENGKTIPGSVETTVYADNAGTEYNGGVFNFTVPGFKSSPEKYAGFYAKSKTEITGGFSGTAPFVSAEKANSTRVALRSALEKRLFEEAKKKISDDMILFSGGFSVKMSSEPEGETSDKKVLIEEKGIITAFAFPKQTLASYIARRALLRYDGAPVFFEKTDDLMFEFLNKADFGKNGDTKVLFSLKGSGVIIWMLEEDEVARALAGKEKSDTVSTLSLYPGINRSSVIIRPFWKSSFPENPQKIKVVTSR